MELAEGSGVVGAGEGGGVVVVLPSAIWLKAHELELGEVVFNGDVIWINFVVTFKSG